MKLQILWAMVLVSTAFGAVVTRDKPTGSDLEVDEFMISEEENAMDYHKYAEKQNVHSMRSNGLEDIQCDYNGQYHPHPTCCYKYVHCFSSIPYERSCPDGTAWSETNPPCHVHDYNSKCGPRPPKDNQIEPDSSATLPSCSCGIANTNNRIVGGIEVDPPQKYPWQVGLWRPGYYFKCGGSIINNKFILTAAHCFDADDSSCNYNPNPDYSLIRIGEHDQDDASDDDGIIIPIKRIIIHPCYSCRQNLNDFALLELNDAIVFNDVIRPVCLPEDDSKTYVGELATVTGWGATTYEGDSSPKLLEVDVTILANNNCGNYTKSEITSNRLCAGDLKDGGEDACQGDSGGPLVVKEQKGSMSRFVQVGVVSEGEGCGLRDHPGIYSRVSKVLNWIKEKSARGQYCAN